MHQKLSSPKAHPDNATYDAVSSDDTLFGVCHEDGVFRLIPVLSRIVVERQMPFTAIKPTLRVARALLRNDTPDGPRTSRLIDTLHRAAGHYVADRERTLDFVVFHRVRRDGFAEPQVVLRQALTGCRLVRDALIVEAPGAPLVLDEVTFVVDTLVEELP